MQHHITRTASIILIILLLTLPTPSTADPTTPPFSLLDTPITVTEYTTPTATATTYYILMQITKSDLLTIPDQDWQSLTDFIPTQKSTFSWFTISFGDGTGLVFTGCSPLLCAYGTLNENNMLLSSILLRLDFDSFDAFIAEIKALSEKSAPSENN